MKRRLQAQSLQPPFNFGIDERHNRTVHP